jgi:hypothetical protein
MFRAPLCSSSGESIVLMRLLVYVTLCMWPSGVQVWMELQLHPNLHTGRSLTDRVTYTRCHINIIDSPDDEHRGARNIYRIGINIYEKRTVRQVGYLQESDTQFTYWFFSTHPFLALRNLSPYSIIFNPLNAEFNPISHLLALLGAHPILHVSRIRVNLHPSIPSHSWLVDGCSIQFYPTAIKQNVHRHCRKCIVFMTWKSQ